MCLHFLVCPEMKRRFVHCQLWDSLGKFGEKTNLFHGGMCCWYLFEFYICSATVRPTRSDDKIYCLFRRIPTHVCQRYSLLYNISIDWPSRLPHRMEWWRVSCIMYCLMLSLASTVSSVEISFSSENNKKTFVNIAVHGGARGSEAKTPKQKHEKFICFVRSGDVPLILYTIFHQSHWLVWAMGAHGDDHKVRPFNERMWKFFYALELNAGGAKTICLDATVWQLN